VNLKLSISARTTDYPSPSERFKFHLEIYNGSGGSSPAFKSSFSQALNRVKAVKERDPFVEIWQMSVLHSSKKESRLPREAGALSDPDTTRVSYLRKSSSERGEKSGYVRKSRLAYDTKHLIDVGQNFQFHGSCLRLNVAIGITRGLIDEIPKFRLFPRCKVSSHNHGLLTQIRQIPFVIYDIVVGPGFALHLAIEHLAPLTEKSVERNQTGFSAFPSLLRPRSQAVKRDPRYPNDRSNNRASKGSRHFWIRDD
jgi:hypothetical protein